MSECREAHPTSTGIFVASVSSTPAPQLITPLETVLGFSPDNSKLLYTDSAQVGEIAAAAGGYRHTGRHGQPGLVRLHGQYCPGPGSRVIGHHPYIQHATLWLPATVTPSGTVAYAVDVSGFAQGIVTLGEVASGGSAPANTNLQLVNVLAANSARSQPLYLASLSSTPSLHSPAHLSSYVSKVVTQ